MHITQRWEDIYNQINGAYIPGVCEGIGDETAEEGVLTPLIEMAYAARDRLAGRLGTDPGTDSDFEQLVSGFEDLSRACGRLMYFYGYRDGQRAAGEAGEKRQVDLPWHNST